MQKRLTDVYKDLHILPKKIKVLEDIKEISAVPLYNKPKEDALRIGYYNINKFKVHSSVTAENGELIGITEPWAVPLVTTILVSRSEFLKILESGKVEVVD